MSIGFYSPGWPAAVFPNGIVTYIATLAPVLRTMGHEITVLAAQVAGECSDESVYNLQQSQTLDALVHRVVDPLWHRIAPRHAFHSTSRRRLLTGVRRAIAERGIQLVEMEESFGWARWITRATSIPVSVRLHGPWFLNGLALGAPEDAEYRQRVRDEGDAIRAADAITAPSQNVLSQVRDFYGFALREAEVIPAPTLPVPIAERWRLETRDPNRVLFVGRFDRHKGGDLIIEAFGRVLQVIPEAKLSFVGPDRGFTSSDGENWNIENFIRKRIPGALETGRIEWLGQKPFSALAELRRKAALTVVCSRYENFPLTVVEPMALGCPVVAAKAGGIPEIVQDGINGLLHQSEDASDLAIKIVQLMQDPALAVRLGCQAAADCERRYYPEVVASRFAEFYRRAIGDRERHPRSTARRRATHRSLNQ